MFHVGQKVVCVDDDWHPQYDRTFKRPVHGHVYVVREVEPRWISQNDGLRLMEITNPIVRWSDGQKCELAFRSNRFRPVVERKTDISVFTAMLNSKKSRVRV